MFMNPFVLRVFIWAIVAMLSITNPETNTKNINAENNQCVIESAKTMDTNVDLFVDGELVKNDECVDGDKENVDVRPNDNVSELETMPTGPVQQNKDVLENAPNGENDDGRVPNKPKPTEHANDAMIDEKSTSHHGEINASAQTSSASDKNDTAKTDVDTGEAQLPYDGDTAVPPDVVGNSVENAVNQTSQVCNQHNFILLKTEIDTQYELYNYVTDYYKCEKCDCVNTDTHIASANISDWTINNVEADIIAHVNKLRIDNGLNELWVDGRWDEWADTRAVELESIYGHCRPGGEDWLYAIDGYYTIGENIASGQASGIDFYNAFYQSAQHHDLMLAEDAVGIAVGIYVNKDGTPYCAMVLIGAY